jgi:hypothetical protein
MLILLLCICITFLLSAPMLVVFYKDYKTEITDADMEAFDDLDVEFSLLLHTLVIKDKK